MKKLFVVATPIGNLQDISERAIKTLNEVDIILCEDTRHSLKLLNHYNIKKKLISYHKFNEQERTKEILELLKENNIALITDAGTPCISDPGYILIKTLKENNIEVIGVGGISALVTALSVSGINTDKFSFLGFFPREKKNQLDLLENIKKSTITTFVIYESPKRIIKTLEIIKEQLGNILISISSDLTKIHEKNYYGTLDKVLKELKENEKSNLGEYTIVFEKEKPKQEDKTISLEARLIDIMKEEKAGLKDAINILNNDKNLHKKDIYNASLNLKELLKK